MFRALAIVGILSLGLLNANVAEVKAEPNLEKRSVRALEQLDTELDSARRAYEGNQLDQFRNHLQTAGDMAELSRNSLEETGKAARRSPKWFKRAEKKLREQLRRVATLAADVSVEDREVVEALRTRMRAVHEGILHDIMTEK